MRELSLFSGCGGGLLASKLLGWRTLGYVEREAYRCRVLAQRISDGILENAPVYCGRVSEFVRGGYAESYKGLVDVLSAGFPCQPFTNSGKQLAAADERNAWPETLECIKTIQPPEIFLENVPGLLAGHGYFRTILQDLAGAGYNAAWACVGAENLGATHKRKRLWILAHADQTGRPASLPTAPGRENGGTDQHDDDGEEYLWPAGPLEYQHDWETPRLLNTERGRCLDCGNAICLLHGHHEPMQCCPGLERHCRACDEWTTDPDTSVCQWCGERMLDQSELAGMLNGDAGRMDRFEAIGDAQVGIVAAFAYRTLERNLRRMTANEQAHRQPPTAGGERKENDGNL